MKIARYVSFLLVIAMFFSFSSFSGIAGFVSPFEDVSDTAWYSESIQYVYQHGLMNGVSNNYFAPDRTTTRAMIVTILYRQAGSPIGYSASTFQDVVADTWYTVPIAWAEQNDIVNGYSETQFGPNDDITREQMAVILYRYASSCGLDTTARANLSSFSDNGKISSWARDALSWANATQLVNGVSEKELQPGGNATRAQAATILMRFCKWTEGNQQITEDVLASLQEKGTISIEYDLHNNISAIEGPFVDRKVNSTSDAAEVINMTSGVFGDQNYAESESIVKLTDPSLENLSEENYYVYTPNVNGIPVLGSQAILVTDCDGTVKKMFSSFDENVMHTDTNPTITEQQAIDISLSNLFQSEKDIFAQWKKSMESQIGDTLSDDQVRSIFMASVEIHASLAVFVGDSDGGSELVYSVTIQSKPDSENLLREDLDTFLKNARSFAEIDLDTEDLGLYLSKVYYITANGEQAGSLSSCADLDCNWNFEDTSIVAQDLKGEARPINVIADDLYYYAIDRLRNIEVYKCGFKISKNSEGSYYLEDTLPGRLCCGRQLDKHAVSCMANMEYIYDYYLNVLNQKSYDNEGSVIQISYDSGNVLSNYFHKTGAQWITLADGRRQMRTDALGNPEAAIDILAHEFTHGVMQFRVWGGGLNTSIHESGSLNEAYADIMGNIIEGSCETGDWRLGEDYEVKFDMSDPASMGAYTHYQEYNKDEGIHRNSSIFSFAAYKMITDARCKDLTGTDWAKVFYRSMRYLTTDATFLSARFAVQSAAHECGLSDDQMNAIADAFDSVGIQSEHKASVRATGTILDGTTGLPVPGITVNYYNLSGDKALVASAVSGKNGQYTISGLEAKSYRIEASDERTLETETDRYHSSTIYNTVSANGAVLDVVIHNQEFPSWLKVSPSTYSGKPKNGMMVSGNNATGKCVIPAYWGQYPIVEIASKAFRDCRGITEVVLPPTILTIGSVAFCNCTGLKTIKIPQNVVSINSLSPPFVGCNNLTEIEVDAKNANYCSVDGILYSKDMKTLLECPGGKQGSICVPNGVEWIGLSAFAYCAKIEGITLPDSVAYICADAFLRAESLKEIAVPEGVDVLDTSAFEGCIGLTDITIPASVRKINTDAFSGCNSLENIWYLGSIAQWGSLWNNIYSGNDCFKNAEVHYLP